MHFTIGELLGSAGVTLLLIAFLINLLKKWQQEDLPYILLNIIGTALTCASSIVIYFVPFIILEAAWTLISVAALFKFLKANKSTFT